jgi:dienelactone hydrolase
VLVGAEDVWTPAAPCKEVFDGAVARGAKVTVQIYPGAYHDFDWPNMGRMSRQLIAPPATAGGSRPEVSKFAWTSRIAADIPTLAI